ncbi:ly6/PLAUR domain-containing protein 6B-like [Amphibalanus amphitrite]|uniref:ly6/PLAUR domain-containing protein 6B-like n=1 Tax=Amphibalanus amphitrite TaxID=1232801 RepID=UPI001C8FD863|nr:ly6/PLAUR domain-containing protein 6B-like [Amphibalanus amphitrite]
MLRWRPWLPPLLPLLSLLTLLVLSDLTSSSPTAAPTETGAGWSPPAPVNHLTCYFCENVENNYICNRFAIDHPCPAGTTFCRTLHIMDTRGGSVVVNKHCATEDQCRDDRVGCLQQDHQKTCVSCCHSSYCNEPVPTNYSNAVRQPKPTAPTRAVKSAGAAAAPRLLLLLAAAASRLLLLLAAAASRQLLSGSRQL